MNHVYSLVWNRALKALQVASEIATPRGGGVSGAAPRTLVRARLPLAIASALVLALGVTAPAAWAASCNIDGVTYANCTSGVAGGAGGVGASSTSGAGGTGTGAGTHANAGGNGGGPGYSGSRGQGAASSGGYGGSGVTDQGGTGGVGQGGSGSSGGGNGGFSASGGGGGAGGGLSVLGYGGGGGGGGGINHLGYTYGGGGGGGGGQPGETFASGGAVAAGTAILGGAGGVGGAAGIIGEGFAAGGGGGGGAGVLLSLGSLTNAGGIGGGTGGTGGSGFTGDGGGGGGGGAGILMATGTTLTNAGAVSGGSGGMEGVGFPPIAIGVPNAGAGGAGVYAASGATVTNNSPGSIHGGTGAYSSNGVAGNGAAAVSGTGFTLYNSGQIAGGNGGNIASSKAGTAGDGGAAISGAGFTLANYVSGSIVGGDGGLNIGNHGVVGGSGAAVSGTGFTLNNEGLLQGGVAAVIADAVGVVANGNSSITSSGYISDGNGGAGKAVLLSGGGNTLTLEAGYSFTGNVVSTSSTANDGDTLVLGGDASPSAAFDATNIVSALPGSYTGTQYVGFNQLEKTGASTWMLTGTTTVATPWTVDGGTLEIVQSGALGAGAVTVDNTADQNATLTVDGGVSLTNGIALNHGATLNNSGQLDGNVNNIFAVGSLYGAATVHNEGGGKISGPVDAVKLIGAGGTVTNSGVGSVISAPGHGVVTSGGLGEVSNSDGARIGGGNFGVGLEDGGSVINETGAVITGALFGVTLAGSGSVTNGPDSIIETTGTTLGNCRLGAGDCAITAFSPGGAVALTLSNAGSIIGNVQMDPTVANVTTLTAGGSIAGDLDIGTDTASTLTLDGSNTTAQLYSDAVTGTTTFAGALTKAGTGTWVIDSDDLSTVSGTTISAGTLKIGNGGATGSVGNADITDNGALVFERNDALTFAGAISGTGAVTQNGTGGTTTLDGINTYTGPTTVAKGTLLVGDATHTTASIAGGATVQSGGTLGGFGTVGATSTTTEIASGGVLSPGAGSGSVGTLAIGGDLTFDAGSVLDYDLGMPASPNPFATAGAGDSVNVAGTLAFGGVATLNLAAAGGMGPGLYNLASYGTLATTGCSFSGGTACLTLGTVPGGTQASYYTIVNNASASQIDLYNTAGQALNIWAPTSATSVGGTGTWSATSPTWTDTSGDGLSKMVPQPGFAIFQGTQCANAACAVAVDDDAGDVSVTGMQFAVDGYTLAGDAVTLVDDSSGNAPIIEVGDGSSNSVNMTATIANKLDTSGAGFNKTGAGTLVLDGGFGGTLVNGTVGVQGGTLQLGKGDTSQPVLRSALVMSSGTNLLLSNGVIENANNYSGAVVSGQNFNVTLQTTGSTGLSSIGSAFSVRGMAAIDGTGFTLTLGGNSYVAGGYGAMGSGGGAGGAGGAAVTGAGFTVDNSSAGAGPGGYGNGIYGGAGGRTATTGAGGAGGIAISGTDFTVVNSGNIFGGEGGLTYTGNTASPGLGGAAIGGSGFALTNTGAVTGGAGGYVSSFAGATGGVAGGVGVYSTGNSMVINEGTISGGMSGDGTTQADAIDFTGGDNMLELVAGHPGTFNGAIVVTRAAGDAADTLELGGDTGSDTFDLAQLASGGEFGGFNAEAKSGASTWTLTGTGSSAENWMVEGGTLNGDATAFQGNITFAPATGATAAVVFNQGSGNTNSTPDGIFAGVIVGAGNVTKSGDGTLTLTGASTFTDGTTISAGTLQIGNGGTTGSIVGDVIDNGTLVVNHSDNPVLSGVISGSGALVQAGSGMTILTGDNTFTGGTTIASGMLHLGDGGTTGSIVGNVIDNGTLVVNHSDDPVLSGVISGSGALVQAGSGMTILTGDNTFTGGTTIASGMLHLGDGGTTGSIVGNVIDNGTLVVNHSDNPVLSGVISGSGALVQAGSGMTILTGDNTFTGGTTIASGMLHLGDGGTTGSIVGNVIDNGTLVVNHSDNPVLSGVISGSGALVQAGSGMTTLTGVNTFTGGTTIASGMLHLGDGGTTGSIVGHVIDNGTLVVNHSDNPVLSGVISGSGALVQAGSGMTTLTGVNTFTGGTTVGAGTLQVASDANLGAASGGVTLDGGALANTAALTTARTINIGPNGGTLALGADLTTTGTIDGEGGLTKTGSATLTIDGDGSAFTGTTHIAAGNLVVGDDAHTNAVIAGMVNVAKGATISGAGTVGGLDLSGTLLPGDPGLGTFNVSGNATFEPGSTFQLTATPAGDAGKLAVGGKVDIKGGNTIVMAQPGNWAPRTQYTIVTAGSGVTGQFAGVSDDQAFLTPSLAYGVNAVTLTLLRNNINFGTVATTPNEKGVAAGIEGLGFGNVLYAAVVKLNAADARTAFDQTSGEYHASEQAARVDDSRYVREAMNQRLRTGDVDPEATQVGHLTAWAHAWGHWGTQDGDGNVAKLSDNGDGLLVGADLPVGTQSRIGVAGGTSRNSLSVKDRNAWGRDTSTWLGLYGGYDLNAFGLRGGIAYAWDQIPTNRQIAFPGYTDRVSGNATGHTLTGFVEGAWTFHFNDGTVSPFLNLAHTKVTTAASTEAGGAAALHAYATGENVSFSTLGVRGRLNLSDHFNLHGELGWLHAFGDTTPTQNLGFVAGGPTFTEYGVPIAKNAGLGRIGLGWHQGKVAIDADYEGLSGGGAKDQAAKLSVSVRF